MSGNLKELSAADFCRHFGTTESELPEACWAEIAVGNFRYRVLEAPEQEAAILRVLKRLKEGLEASGPGRQHRWEKGWSENLEEMVAAGFDLKKLVPKFVRGNELIRLDGHYVMPESGEFETHYVRVLRAWLFHRYFSDATTLYEFGVGSGHNLIDAAQKMPGRKFVGLDWAEASKKILDSVRDKLSLDVHGHVFNLFEPDQAFDLDPDSAVLTIGTLEQLGTGFGPFIDYLLAKRPKRCVHVETLYEVYNQDSLFDWVAGAYLEHRNYLRGFLPHLRELERQGRIRIVALRRTFGSFFHDGYTYVVWEPV